jgi:hypothetical protein
MARIPIWPGSSSFFPGDTPFGFYDNDNAFRTDAELTANWCAKRLGYPIVDVELQAINFFTVFEEAVNEYGAQLYNFQIINNFHTLEGNATGSAFNNKLITPNLGNTVNISEQYGNETDGGGGDYQLQRGTLDVKAGDGQRYDLLANTSSSISGSEDVYIKKVYHYAPPAINRYFDPYAGTGTGIQSLMQSFGFGNFSPGVNFMLMPIYYDVLKLQAIEFNDQIRKSGYKFEIQDNRYLKLFPIPNRSYTLHFDYVLQSVANNPVKNTKGVISDISNVPYNNVVYERINEPGRQWIRKYTLALSKEILGGIRGKYQSLPIPGETTTLDYSRLLSEASAEKEKLIEELQKILEETTRVKQLERQEQEAELTQKTFYKVPYPIYIY